MTDEKTQTENIQKTSEQELAFSKDTEMVSEEPRVEEDEIIELSDTREYPNQRDLMNHIVALYNQLNPPHKKLVRLTIARPSKEL